MLGYEIVVFDIHIMRRAMMMVGRGIFFFGGAAHTFISHRIN